MELEAQLCAAFCGGLQVHAVPAGYAVSTSFADSSGDRISFYICETPDGFELEDDGSYLADLVARDINIESGFRGDLLKAILDEGNAFWDADTFEIKTGSISQKDLANRAILFLSSLIRVRDLAHVTKDRVRSAFREDFINAVTRRFGSKLNIEENTAPANDLSEFPADLVLRTEDGETGAVYLVTTNDKLNEALLAWQEREKRDSPVAMMAVLEDMDMKNISKRRFQRAQNRRLPMPVFRGDEDGTLDFIVSAMQENAA